MLRSENLNYYYASDGITEHRDQQYGGIWVNIALLLCMHLTGEYYFSSDHHSAGRISIQFSDPCQADSLLHQ